MLCRTQWTWTFLFLLTTHALTLQKRDTFLISFDGVLARTATLNAEVAIETALLTWPDDLRNLNEILEDRTWLINKMLALSHLPMLEAAGVERVLLARLLMEEQLLDQQRSVGKSGKYASKFHPQSISVKTENDVNSNPNGSRPLTVGEISANWNDTLREALRFRYNVNKKDPFPVMRENLLKVSEHLMNDGIHPPIINKDIFHAISECSGDIHVLLSSEAQCNLVVHQLLSSNAFNANLKVNPYGSKQTSVPDLIKDTYPQGSIDMSLPTVKLTFPREESTRISDIIIGLINEVEDESDVFVMCDYGNLLATKNNAIGPDR